MKSKYTDREISVAQYLVELICERQAKKNNTTLRWRFWNDEAWKVEYRKQMVFVNALLKLFPAEVIIKALNATPWIQSYASPVLKKNVLLEHQKFLAKPETPNTTIEITPESTEKTHKSYVSNSLFRKLQNEKEK